MALGYGQHGYLKPRSTSVPFELSHGIVYEAAMGSGVADQTFTKLNAIAKAEKWPMRCDGELAFGRPELGALLELWRSKAAGGIPARAAFDMRALKAFLTHMIILERHGSGEGRRYMFRLFGSAHLQLFGEHTGRYLDEMVSAKMLPSWLAVYDAVLSTRQPLRIETHFRVPSSNFLRGEIFAAPMANSSGAEDMILAATYVNVHDVVPSPFD